MHVSALRDSKFLKKEDCGQGILCTIKGVEEINVAKEGAPQEFKWCLWLEEQEKPLVLNSTNGQIIAQICGSEETDDWRGHKIVLYNDPSISFAGKITGGIRARAPRNQPKAVPSPAPITGKFQVQAQTAPRHKSTVPQPLPVPEPDPTDPALGDPEVPF